MSEIFKCVNLRNYFCFYSKQPQQAERGVRLLIQVLSGDVVCDKMLGDDVHPEGMT